MDRATLVLVDSLLSNYKLSIEDIVEMRDPTQTTNVVDLKLTLKLMEDEQNRILTARASIKAELSK